MEEKEYYLKVWPNLLWESLMILGELLRITNDEEWPFSALCSVDSGVGADPSKPQCRKAKDIRKERRLQKEQQKQQDGGGTLTNLKPAPGTPTSDQPKPLEELITDSLPDDPLHCLEVRNNHVWFRI